MSERGTKIKVGVLVIVSLSLLVGFVGVLGTFSFGKQLTYFIELSDSGSILAGAPVKIAGVRAGRVQKVDFLVARDARKSAKRNARDQEINVRLTVQVKAKMAPAVREDSEFYITNQGVLGERYLEIAPGSAASTPWPDGAYIRGRDPARIDLLFIRMENVLSGMEEALGGDDLRLDEFIATLRSVATRVDGYLARNEKHLDQVTANLSTTSDDLRGLTAALRHGVGDGSEIREIVTDVQRVSGTLARQSGPMISDARRTLGRVENTAVALEKVANLLDENRDAFAAVIGGLPGTLKWIQSATRDVAAITADLAAGRGSLGQMLKDETLYDDVKELLRDLKRHPWKMLWRE